MNKSRIISITIMNYDYELLKAIFSCTDLVK